MIPGGLLTDGFPFAEELRERAIEPLDVLLGPKPHEDCERIADLNVASAHAVPKRSHLFDAREIP